MELYQPQGQRGQVRCGRCEDHQAAHQTSGGKAWCRNRGLDGVPAGDLGVPAPASFDGPLLGRVVDGDQSKAFVITPRPLEVIEQRPDEIPAERHAVSNRAIGLEQMLMQVRLALWVVDLSLLDD